MKSPQPGIGFPLFRYGQENRWEPGKFRFARRHPSVFFSRIAELHVWGTGLTKMSEPLVVSIPHRLGREEAKRRLKDGLTRASASVPVLKIDEARWDGDRLMFCASALGQVASGQINVAEDHVRVEVTLPWLLQRFAEAAQVAIKNRGQLLLTKKN
jgi:hypothetical protein